MAELLRRLGCEVDHDLVMATLRIDVPEQLHHQADYDLVRRMRASICVLGPLVARCTEQKWRCRVGMRSDHVGSTCTSQDSIDSVSKSTTNMAT